MSAKIGNLTPSDFPGIDEAKFSEWKALKLRQNRERRMVLYVGFGILFILGVVSVLTGKPMVLLVFLIFLIIDDIFFFYRRRYRHLRRLGNELKMSARLKAKRNGQAFAG